MWTPEERGTRRLQLLKAQLRGQGPLAVAAKVARENFAHVDKATALVCSPCDEDVFYLWAPGTVPGSLPRYEGDTEALLPQHAPDIEAGALSGSKAFNYGRWPQSHLWRGAHAPALRVFRPRAELCTGASMVVAPGGGFVNLPPHEGDAVAEWLADHGVTAFLLRYRLVSSGYPIPTQLRDMQRAVRLVRHHATAWGLDPTRIGVLGVSGGGHVASGAAVWHDQVDPVALGDAVDGSSARPDIAVLVYPLTNPAAYSGFTDPSRRVSVWGEAPPDPGLFATAPCVVSDTCPTFISHSTRDTAVTAADHSDPYFAALQRKGVDSEYVRLDFGSHGCGLVGAWARPCIRWLVTHRWASPQSINGTAYVYDFEHGDDWQSAVEIVTAG